MNKPTSIVTRMEMFFSIGIERKNIYKEMLGWSQQKYRSWM